MNSNKSVKTTLASLVLTAVTLLLTTASTYADEFWNLADYFEVEAVFTLDDLAVALSTQQAIKIPANVIRDLATGTTLSLEIAPNQVFDYRITGQIDYLNGDKGWQAALVDNPAMYPLSLTVTNGFILATIYSPIGKYHLRAIASTPAPDEFTGWVYSQALAKSASRTDNGGIMAAISKPANQSSDSSALSGSDVTIVQTPSEGFISPGDTVEFSVQVTNNLNTSLENEGLTVFFALDVAEYVSDDGDCTVSIAEPQNTLNCTLPTIAPGASHTLNYALQSNESSYPFIPSGVFVGDAFGEAVRNDEFVIVIKDTLIDTDNDGISDFNEEILNTDPANSSSVIADDFVAEVDLMFLYTQRYLDDIGNSPPETEINQLVQLTNNIFTSSGVDISFRPVYYGFTEYDANGDLYATINALIAESHADLQTVPAIRDRLGADIVVVIDGLFTGGDLCGLAVTPGEGFEGELLHPIFSNHNLFVTLFLPGYPAGEDSGCDELSLAHELGHNFGLNHSRRQIGSGTFAWSLGHGVDGSFVTIMADEFSFPGSTELPLFSSPLSTECQGLPCGVSRTDLEQGADAVYSLTQTRFQVANIADSNILATVAASGESTSAIMFGGASKTGDDNNFLNAFNSQDSINLSVSLEIPSEHQGALGITHILILVEGGELFQLSPQGEYVSWEGTLETLTGNIAPRALNSTEELVAFSNLVPADVGVDSAALTVFFAYSLTGSDVLIYSETGVPLSISP